MRSTSFNGMNRLRIDSESVEIENRDIVSGINAIWKRIACLDPNAKGAINRFAQ
jgi:hypothetical protein